MENIHTELFQLKVKANTFERENHRTNNFRGTGAVQLCVNEQYIPDFEKQGFRIEKSAYWGNILYRFSTNGALQDIENMLQEFINNHNEFYLTTWID